MPIVVVREQRSMPDYRCDGEATLMSRGVEERRWREGRLRKEAKLFARTPAKELTTSRAWCWGGSGNLQSGRHASALCSVADK